MPDDTDAPDLPSGSDGLDEPDGPAAAAVDDARDDALAGLLAVDPLDDLTRQRLVATALRSTGSARRARMLVAAAAIVVLVVVGAGVVVAIRGTGSDQRLADRAGLRVGPTADAEAGADNKSGSRSPSAASAAEPTELGDFGELTIAANRQRLVTAAAGAASASGAAAVPSGAQDQSSALASRKLANLDCTVQGLPSGTVTALGTGTLDATAVIVVVTTTPGGTRVISTVDTGTCRVRPLA